VALSSSSKGRLNTYPMYTLAYKLEDML